MTITFDAYGKWETNFNYGPCSLRGSDPIYTTSCNDLNDDGLDWEWGGHGAFDRTTHVTTSAKNPLSPGSHGMRFLRGSGHNRQSGPFSAILPGGDRTSGQVYKEWWLRWYVKYGVGFNWVHPDTLEPRDYPHYVKDVYSHSIEQHTGPILGWGDNEGSVRCGLQGTGTTSSKIGSVRWRDLWGHPANGSWHCIEFYIKAETDRDNPDGIIRIWVNGQLVHQSFNNNMYNNKPGVFSNGLRRIGMASNQNRVGGDDQVYHTDFDDICLYVQTPPNVDNNGNPFIGPLDWGGTVQLQVGISANPTAGEAPLEVNFTGSASGGSSPYTYAWDFKDGNTSTTQNPIHTYTSSGQYVPTLTVTDAQQDSKTASTNINVQSTEEPAQYFTNFEEYTIGSVPHDWTIRDSTGVGWEVKSKHNTTVLTALADPDPSGNRRLITWDEPGQRRHYELLILYRTASATRHASLFSRTVGDPHSGDCYQLRIRDDAGTYAELRRLNAGSETILHTTSTLGLGADTWYAMRFRTETLASGNVRLRVSIWAPSDLSNITNDEPTWLFTVEDSHSNRLLSNGHTGVGTQRNDQEIDIAFFGVGVGGATAPEGQVDDWEPPDEPTGEVILTHDGWEFPEAWYDGTPGPVENGVLVWHWQAGNKRPDGVSISARKHMSKAVSEFYCDIEMRLSSNWRGSGVDYHPHIIHVISTDDGDWTPLANTHNSLYFEALSDTSSPYTTYPAFALQDSQRVNTGHGTPPVDLVGITENRAAGHCNTPIGTQGEDISGNGGTKSPGTCYPQGDGYYSAMLYKGGTVNIPVNQWVNLRYYVKMNTFTNNVGNFDGIMKIWINDTLAFHSEEMLWAAGNFQNTKWDKIALGAWISTHIGDGGSPIDQTMWLRSLTMYEGMPDEEVQPDPDPDLEILWQDNGWDSAFYYDGDPGNVIADGVLELHWQQGNTRPNQNTGAMRAEFTEPVTEFTLDYDVRFEHIWTSSFLNGLFYIAESQDGTFWSVHVSNCSVYSAFIIDDGSIYLRSTLQDRERVNINHGTPPVDLRGVTENRAASACNTPYSASSFEGGICEETSISGIYRSMSFADGYKEISRNDWFRIRMYCKMNTITSNIGNFDGILRMYVNKELVFFSDEVLYRAGNFPNTRWDKIAFAPFISGGSPIDQTMWIRNAKVYHGEMIYPTIGDSSILFGGNGELTVGGNGFFRTI